MIYATRYSGKIILFPGMPIAYLMVKDAKCHSQKLYEMITNSVWTHHRTLERQTSVSDRKIKRVISVRQ